MYFQEKSKSLRIALVAALTAFGASAAVAGNDDSQLDVSATVGNNCTISAGSLNFGAYDPVTTNAVSAKTGASNLSVTCTKDAAAVITLSQGSHAAEGSSSVMPMRQLANGGNNLAYQLFMDNSYEMVWGDSLDNEGSNGRPYTGAGFATAVTVYGVIPGGQNVPAGSYVDTVIATVNF